VMQTAENLAVVPEVKAGEVEVGQIVALADVEEEVSGSPIVPVLEQFDQREFEKVLVEGDGPFHIAAQESEMMQTPRR
jgi:hypothetical protein